MLLRYEMAACSVMVASTQSKGRLANEVVLLLVALAANKANKHREAAKRICSGSCNITLGVVALLLLGSMMSSSSSATTTTKTSTSLRLVDHESRDTTNSCSDGSSIGAGLSGRVQHEQSHDDDNQSAYQSDHPSVTVVTGRQQSGVPVTMESALSSEETFPAGEQTTSELHPSQSQRTTTATRTDRWWAFNKCNSSAGQEERDGRKEKELDKQLAQPIKAATADNPSRRRIRRHLDVGHGDRLVASMMFVGRHQTSFSSSRSWPPETSLFSLGPEKQQRLQPSSLSIGRRAKRKRPSLEERPLIGSVDGPTQRASVARGQAKAVALETREDEEEDDEETTDAEADTFARITEQQTATPQVGRDNKGRHIQASSEVDAAASKRAGTFLRLNKEETVREIRSRPVGQRADEFDLFKLDDDDRDTSGLYHHPDADAERQHQIGGLGGSEDDQIISHDNLIELMDDDLFLAEGGLPAQHSLSELHDLVSTSPRNRLGRSSPSLLSSSSSSLVPDKMRTIYFGGFFPWLTDEDTTRFTENGASSYAGNNNNDGQQQQTSRNKSNSSSLERQTNNEPTELDSQQSPGHGDNRPWLRTRQRKKQQQQQQQQQQRRKKQYEPGDESFSSTAPPQVAAMAAVASFPQNGLNLASWSPGSVGSSTENDNRHQLGRFILPAVRLALDHINTNSSILDTYKLEIVPRDTQCNATISLKEFFDMVYEEPKKMLLYGDACRVSTDPIAKASYFFDLIQISYADTDPIYTIENYPNFFRVVPSENALSLARIPFIRHFNWTRVGTIYQNLPRYSLPHSKLLTDLERFKIVIKQSVSLPGSIDGLQNRDLGDELRKLKEKDVRIILGNFDEEWALLLFCEAYREKMTGRKYQWILTGVSEDKLWQHYLKKGSDCSEQELLIAMDGYIITDITPVTRSQHRTISGMMAHEYSNEYKRRAREMNIAIEENKFYGYVYDGIWAIALALNRVDSQLRYYNRLLEAGKARLNPELKGITSLLDFDYHKPIWVKLIRNALNKTRFNGVTGTVSFHKNERPGLISFSQFQAFRDMNEVIIGSYDALNDELDLKVGFPIFWRGSSPPIDYTIERVTPFRINRTLFVIISIFASFGIVLATVFLTINIKFRNQRYIKMSSPYLNNLIIIGCILTYTSVIILGLDSGLTSEYNFPYICNARAWVLMAGFTLAFGSMFSKTFRVHSIFTNIKLHKKVIKDYKLFMVVFILLTFDVCILVVWQYFDPFYRETNNGTSIQDPDNEDIIIVPEMEHCQSKRMTIFLSVIYVYKGLLMAFGCFLAWETRHVSIPALNDSKYIGLSVYNVVIMCVIGAGLSFVLRDQQDASFVIISIFIIFCSTTTLCLVFVPKLIELKQNPKAGDHRVRATLKTFKKNYHEEAFGAAGCRDIHGNIIGRGYGINLNERIKILFEENTKQRSSLKEKTYELEALTYKYRKIQAMISSGQYIQALSSTGSATNPAKQAAGQTRPACGGLLAAKSPPTTLLTTTTIQNQSTSSLSRASPEVITQTSDLTAVRNGKLQKSPMMSSATQITSTTNTTTTTTSSTNNTSDLCTTNEHMSSKPLSKAVITSAGGNCCDESADTRSAANTTRQATLVAFEGGQSHSKGKLVSRAPDEAPGRAQRLSQSILADATSKMRAANKTKQSPKYTADSSYCSMGADYELSDARKSSQDNLFNVLSYIEDGNNNDSSKSADIKYNSGRSNTKERRVSRGEYVEGKFNRWSAGPFCTLMVRNTADHQQANNNGNFAAASKPIKPVGKLAHNKSREAPQGAVCRTANEEIRASCPDISASAAYLKSATKLAKQSASSSISHRQNSVAATTEIATNKTHLASRGRLPRTISMIEYLGLSDFDFIARRHDKLVKRKLTQSAKRRQLEQYCCIEENNHCSCCDQSGMADDNSNNNNNNRCPTQSEADMVFSSDDFANSGELARTGSHLSCSTCCSLMSPSYVSHSDYMFDEVSHSSNSLSTEQSSSSGTNDCGSLSPINCNSHSKSSTQSSAYENKESTILNTGIACSVCPDNQRTAASCGHHKQSLHTNHPNPSSGKASSSSDPASQPKATTNQTADGQQQQSLCTSGALFGPGSREDANCSSQVCSNKPTRAGSLMTSSISNNILEELIAVDSDQELQEISIIKCDILESL